MTHFPVAAFLLSRHLFLIGFSVTRKGLFRPMPICDGAFLNQHIYLKLTTAKQQQSWPCF